MKTPVRIKQEVTMEYIEPQTVIEIKLSLAGLPYSQAREILCQMKLVARNECLQIEFPQPFRQVGP